ncbi:MAG: hypothetical protein IT537_08665 [Hyphomicrobiales bacterium]|nr:hypothetical protein [Hyphomicrobiales bacterium]
MMQISEAPREVRRAVYRQERAERTSGKWSSWKRASAPQMAAAYAETDRAVPGVRGWAREIHTVWTNGWACVMVRTIERTSLGIFVDHVAFRTALNAELGWKEKQRIKDELFGPDRMAIEVFPRTADLIDAADMYHLWVFPPGFRFDFGLQGGHQ